MKSIISIIVLMLMFYFNSACSGDQVRRVEGYRHGVVVCVSGGAMLTVNTDHWDDIAVQELVQLAKTCK